MDKLKTTVRVVKIVGGVVISVGIGAVAANLIKATTPTDVKRLTKICIGVGSFFTAGLAAAAANKNFDNTMDSIISMITKFMEGKNETEQQEIVGNET